MQQKDVEELLKKFHTDKCTSDEVAFLESWYAQWNEKIPVSLTSEQLEEDLQLISANVKPLHQEAKQISLWPRIAAAASILLFLSAGGYFLLHKQHTQQIAQNQIHNDVAPGGNKAILTLSNGRQMSLTDAKNGILSKEGSKIVKKAGDGTLSYEGNNSPDKNQPLAYNTVTTPRGGQWSVILPDGTKVMLDAASSIKYPVSFTGNERRVEVTGQAYFEVVHNAAQPFQVITKGQVIEDIGTKFNINAYDDEPVIKTTLLEGAVKVSIPNYPGLVLKPGQQTLLQNNKLTVSEANTDDALGWKNGYFSLNDENIESIMRKLSRWYDIEVEYRGNLHDITLRGEIPRNTSLSQALKILEVANVHFILEGKKIIVTP